MARKQPNFGKQRTVEHERHNANAAAPGMDGDRSHPVGWVDDGTTVQQPSQARIDARTGGKPKGSDVHVAHGMTDMQRELKGMGHGSAVIDEGGKTIASPIAAALSSAIGAHKPFIGKTVPLAHGMRQRNHPQATSELGGRDNLPAFATPETDR